MTDTITDDIADGVFTEVQAESPGTESNVWDGIFSPTTERQASFWFCEFSFPVEGTEGSPTKGMVREVVAASSKGKIIEFLVETVFNPEIQSRTGFSFDNDGANSDAQFHYDAVKAFFSAPGRNLYVSLVPVL